MKRRPAPFTGWSGAERRFDACSRARGFSLAGGLLWAACATDTTHLERRPGGFAGDPQTPVGALDAARPGSSTDPSDQDETVPPVPPPSPPLDDEPQGRWALTLLHAVVDAERLAFCLVELDPEGERSVYPQPLPGEDGLRFGQSVVLDLPEELDLTRHELQLVAVRLVAGSAPRSCAQWLEDYDGLPSPSSTTDWSWAVVGPGVTPRPAAQGADAGLDAGPARDGGVLDAAANPSDALVEAGPAADAAPDAPTAPDASAAALSGREVRRLVRWPAGSLAAEYSYLLAVSGCFTGYGPIAERAAACGQAAAQQGSSLTGRFTRLSRKRRFDSLSVQGFNASAAHPEVGLRSIPAEQGEGLYFVLADRVAFGQALPMNAVRGIGVADLGSELDQVTLEVYGASGQVLETLQWGEVFAQSPVEALSNAQPVVLAFLGAPSNSAPHWANPASAVLLFSDPRSAQGED